MVTCSGPPVPHNYQRDMILEVTLNTNAMESELDLKTWGFLIYPNDNDEGENSFDALMKQILFNSIILLA
jgi:hypothetical protein